MIKTRSTVLRCEFDGAILLISNLTSDLLEGQYRCALCPMCPRDDRSSTRKFCPVCGVLNGHAPNDQCMGYQLPEEVFGEDQKREQLLLKLKRQKYRLDVVRWMANEGAMYELQLRFGTAEDSRKAARMILIYKLTRIDKMRLTESVERATMELELFDFES